MAFHGVRACGCSRVNLWCPVPESNWYASTRRQLGKLLCLPIPSTGRPPVFIFPRNTPKKLPQAAQEGGRRVLALGKERGTNHARRASCQGEPRRQAGLEGRGGADSWHLSGGHRGYGSGDLNRKETAQHLDGLPHQVNLHSWREHREMHPGCRNCTNAPERAGGGSFATALARARVLVHKFSRAGCKQQAGTG